MLTNGITKKGNTERGNTRRRTADYHTNSIQYRFVWATIRHKNHIKRQGRELELSAAKPNVQGMI